MIPLSLSQRTLLAAMVRTGKPLVRHRDGWTLADGSVWGHDVTVVGLVRRGLAELVSGTAQCRHTAEALTAVEGA